MRRQHHATLKFHTIYNVILAVIFSIMILFLQEAAFIISIIFLLLYISGNGIIHARNNKLNQDTLIEYLIVSVAVLVLIVGFIR